MNFSFKADKTCAFSNAFAGASFACAFVRLIADAVLASFFVTPGIVCRAGTIEKYISV